VRKQGRTKIDRFSELASWTTSTSRHREGRMIRPFHLEDFVARFHENGNAQSFYACAFTYKGQKLQAVMFGNREFMTHDYCAILSNDVNQPWRGDEFEPALRVLIDKLSDEAFSGDATGSHQ
jgi:hypothetical protein